MQKPICVYVSGAPGSGKTTLSHILSEQLYIPIVSSDLIHGGVAFTEPGHDRQQTLKHVFVPVIIDMAKRGVSCVVDQVLQKGVSEEDIINKLRPYVHLINIHTICDNPVQRYAERVQNSTTPSVVARRTHMMSLVPQHEKNLPKTYGPLLLGVPQLVVNTEKGYNPGVPEVVNFIRSNQS